MWVYNTVQCLQVLLTLHVNFADTVDLSKIPDEDEPFWKERRGRPSKQFLTKSLAWSEISFNFALAE